MGQARVTWHNKVLQGEYSSLFSCIYFDLVFRFLFGCESLALALCVRVRPQSPEISTLFSPELGPKENSGCQRVAAILFSSSVPVLGKNPRKIKSIDRFLSLCTFSYFVVLFSFRFLEYLFAHRLDEIPGKMNWIEVMTRWGKEVNNS